MTENDKKTDLTPWQQKHLEYQEELAKANPQAESIEKGGKARHLFGRKKKEDEVEEESSYEAEGEGFSEEEAEPYEAEGLSDEAFDEAFDDETFEEVEEDEKRPYWLTIRPIFIKMWPALAVVLVVLLGSLYFMSPMSKIGAFAVTGNKHEETSAVVKSSGLHQGDSIFSILRHKKIIEGKIASEYPYVEAVKLKYSFPNKFTALVTEHAPAAYVQQSNKSYLVLDNAYIDKSKEIADVKGLPVLVNFSDEQTKTFVQAYESLKPSLQKLMTTVNKTPTDATKDFISIDMTDGNQVRVPLSQMAIKLPYYPNVAKQITAPQVVDMEAGIYAKSKDAYAADLASISESKSSSIQASIDAKASSEANASSSSSSSSDGDSSSSTDDSASDSSDASADDSATGDAVPADSTTEAATAESQ
ncbi:cell division protein FtsQ/DivIB [Lactococcus termiticola]|uniref:Cell division protein DivIB n=1 Tax=Lactococcus termiticola TaxID=2169526 RepID=A0A2R5HJB9_9LACT|nr:cell division protein FtsQ/DivIB [Lactococcus termiticola]GBG96650.1 cell division protein FtsQ [Lactococcus termiticola]